MHFGDVNHEDCTPLSNQSLINAGSWAIRGSDPQVRIADLAPASRGPSPDRQIKFQTLQKGVRDNHHHDFGAASMTAVSGVHNSPCSSCV